MPETGTRPCLACEGTGKVENKTCTSCKGEGRIRTTSIPD